MKAGHIYLLRNPSFKENYHKLGKTTDTVEKRSKKLAQPTGVPSGFLIVYQHAVSDCDKAENLGKERLKKYRVADTEFFELPQNEAIKVLIDVVNIINAIPVEDEPNPFAGCVSDNIRSLFESGEARAMDGDAFKLWICNQLTPLYERLFFTGKEFSQMTGLSEKRVVELAAQLKFETEEMFELRRKKEEDDASAWHDEWLKKKKSE